MNGQITQTPQVDPNTNRFTSGDYSYDFNGNIVKDLSDSNQIRNFTFNGDNKQTEIKDDNGYSIGRYFYDGEGRRVKKVTNTEETVFVYDGSGKLIAEYSTNISQTPQTKYLTEDHLGTPRIITDANGQITARRDFLPFGEDLFAGVGARNSAQKYGATADDIRQKFTGYQKDRETSLDFAEARMYENRFGRFTAVDPLLASGKSADPQTFNRYVYVSNNPIVLTDPTGLFGDYFNRQGGFIGSDRIDDGKTYLADDTGRREEHNGVMKIIVENVVETSYLELSRLYVPKSNVQPLMASFGEGLDSIGTGVRRGLANLAIGTWNFLSVSNPPPGTKPSPFYITPYPYDDLRQARFGTGIEIGIPAGLGVAGGALSGGSSPLSVVPERTRLFSNLYPKDTPGPAKIRELSFDGDKWRATGTNGTTITPNGRYNFVVQDDRVFISRLRINGVGGHVDLSRGNPVQFAGEIRFGHGNNAGNLRFWSNASGHFRPPARFSNQAPLPQPLFTPIQF